MTTPSLYLGIDPDLRTLNCALLTDDKVPLAVFVRRNKSKRTGDGAVSDAVRVAGLLADDVLAFLVKNERYQNRPIVLIVESQSMQQAVQYRRTGRKIDYDDILHTGQIAGILMGVFSEIATRTVLVQPIKWKGQIPKQIHHGRIYGKVRWPLQTGGRGTTAKGCIYPEDYSCLTAYSGDRVNPGDFEDVNDSLGIALWGVENNL